MLCDSVPDFVLAVLLVAWLAVACGVPVRDALRAARRG
jgi:hypothetical protein